MKRLIGFLAGLLLFACVPSTMADVTSASTSVHPVTAGHKIVNWIEIEECGKPVQVYLVDSNGNTLGIDPHLVESTPELFKVVLAIKGSIYNVETDQCQST